jgi:hypothetical protein
MATGETRAWGPRKWLGFGAGVAAGVLFAFALYFIVNALRPDSGLILISMALIPGAASALAVMVAGIRGDRATGEATLLSLSVVTALMFGSAIFLREGAICLAMAAPVFYPVGVIGAIAATFIGRLTGRRTPPSAVVLAPLLLLAFEQPSAYPTEHAAVVTRIEIDAPIDVVWREAVEIRAIAENEQTWTITHDLLRVPRPTDARLAVHGEQVVREATWRGGVRFNEVVTQWIPEHTVAWTFDIPEAATDQLLDQHLRLDEDYLRLDGGQYDFEALSRTRTRLTLVTRYHARTPLNAYARAWGDLLLGDIHRNVLKIVEQRAEARPPTS